MAGDDGTAMVRPFRDESLYGGNTPGPIILSLNLAGKECLS